jgi:hypothetical protein
LQVTDDYGDSEVTDISGERQGASNMLSTLVFAPVPRGELYKLQSFGLSDGFFIFSYVSSFLALFQPQQYPLGKSN